MAVFRIVNSAYTLSTTYDEPYHIGNGMAWLARGIQSSLEQPPLAQGAVALGLYLAGVRSSTSTDDGNDLGVAVLQQGGDYRNHLRLARLGALPFFVLACGVVWLWARHWFSRAAALWAVLLFVNLPPILGHAGLATVDMACAATVALALYAFVRSLESPSWRRLIFLSLALALAFLSKFSSLAFLGSCFLGAFIYSAIRNRSSLRWRPLLLRVPLVTAVAFMLSWACYHFSSQPLPSGEGAHPHIDRWFAKQPSIRRLAYKAFELPFPPFVAGIRKVQAHNRVGHDSYLFGEYRNTGWWYFFPVVVGLKTPIGFLILAICGIVAMARNFRSSPWQQHLTLIFALAIMLVCVLSRLQVGVRHILAIYPLLAVLSGHGMCALFALAKQTRPAMAVIPIALAAWVVDESWMNRQDYLAYFNQFAGSHPERILAESDLDWGQDLYRLSRRLKELRVDRLSIKYFGTQPLETAGLPPYSGLSPDVPTTHGFVAISVRYLTLEYARNGSFAWLKGKAPLEKVGKSIYLYNLQ
jgi:hypothetical protein